MIRNSRPTKLLNRERFSIMKMSLIRMVLLKMAEQMEDIVTLIQRK
nr:MAG TPA: hypothetical protein [Caudoviricetes sp.]